MSQSNIAKPIFVFSLIIVFNIIIWSASLAAAVQQTPPSNQGDLIDEENYVIPGQMVDASNFGYHESQRLTKENISIGNNSYRDFINLENGNILIAPDSNFVVSVGAANISINSGAAVFIIKSGTDIVIYDLHQTSPKQVSIVVDKNRISMEPGRMLVLTQQNTDDFEKLNLNCHSVIYQNARPLDIGKQTNKAFIADFSMTSALVTIQPLKRLVISNNPQDRLTLAKFVKDAAILQESTVKTHGNL